MFVKPALQRSPYLRDAVVVVAVGDKSRPRPIPLAMLIIKKESLGSHNFYAWFSSVSLVSIGMELPPAAFRAGEAPL